MQAGTLGPDSRVPNIALSSCTLSVTHETSMDEDEREEILTGGLICVSCREYIFVSPADLGRRAVLWRLAHCGHPLHIQCLFYASLPPAQASQGRRRQGGATRIRRPFNPDARPIQRFEDADMIRPWHCPAEGCGYVQFAVLYHSNWFANVDGMTFDGHIVAGPRAT